MGKNTNTTKNKVSAIDFFCIGFGAIVGVGWAVSINSWMAGSGGPLPAAVGYILALVLMIPIALCYCELCAMLPVSGGGMAYAFRAFGDNIAFVSGWAAFGAFITIIPWEAIYVVDILSILFPVLKAGAPLYTLAGADIYIGHILIGLAISVVLFLINRKGVSSSASMQRILCFVLVGAGILAMICAVFKFSTSNFQPVYENIGRGTHRSFFGGAMVILASAPFFLAGFETIPQGIESAGGDPKSVGKTVILTVVLSCLFYSLLLFTLGGAMPWKEFVGYDSPAAALLFRNIYDGPVGTGLYLFILIGAISGLITTWNGFMMASSQILMAMARVSIVPDVLAVQHPEYKTPVNALKVCLIASIAGPFLGSGLIGSLTTFSAAGYVTSWMITAYSLIKLRHSEPALARPYQIPGGEKMAWFAGISMSLLLTLLVIPGQPVFMGKFATFMFIGWMLIGAVLFIIDYRQRRQYSKLKRASFLFASMMAQGDTVLPDYTEFFEDDYRYISFVVPKEADYNGKSLMELGWGKTQNIFIIKIEHGTENKYLPNAKTEIHKGDRVFAVGVEKAILKFRDGQYIGDKYTIGNLKDFMGFGATEAQVPLICREVIVTKDAPYCNKPLKYSGITEYTQCMVIGLQSLGKTFMMPSADTLIEEGDNLWIVGMEEDIERFINLTDAVGKRDPEKELIEWLFEESKEGESGLIAYVGDRLLDGTVRIPDSNGGMPVTKLAGRIFCECKQIEEVILPDTITSIGDAAFAICNHLCKINFPKELEVIPPDCFNECGFTSLVIPDTIKRIGRGAFINNRSLVSISLPSSLKEIELMTFAGCISLQEVVIPEGVRSIGNGAFSSCSSLEDVVMPRSVESIGSMAFLACRSLKKIVLPSHDVMIGDMAFPETTELVYAE